MHTRTGNKPRLVIVSPFLDKRHGTERCVAEQMEHLCDTYDIHLYSERVEQDVDLRNITWHRVPVPPGPHLFRYIWWFIANHACRWKDRRSGDFGDEVVYSPGMNCLDADVIAVHIVFAEFWNNAGAGLAFLQNPWKMWPVLLHRRMYYRLIEFLERHVYSDARTLLAAVSEKTAEAVAKYCGRNAPVTVVYNGLDLARFNPKRRTEMRAASRAALGLPDDAFVILLVGNDWKKKGLAYLLEAVGRMPNRLATVLVAGQDTTTPYVQMMQRLCIANRVAFLPLRPDVEFYYAAADAYAGPSLDDSFALPPAECMACGLPVITTRFNGGHAIMHHGIDGLILENPADVQTLSEWLSRLGDDLSWRTEIGENAARTAAQYTWERNAQLMKELFESARNAQASGTP